MIRRIVSVVTATIAEGAALSDVIDFRGVISAQIEMPAAWTAASLGFYTCSTRAGTFAMLQDYEGTRIEVVAAVDTHIQLQTGVIASSAFLKLWSQTDGAGVNQVGARAITVILKT